MCSACFNHRLNNRSFTMSSTHCKGKKKTRTSSNSSHSPPSAVPDLDSLFRQESQSHSVHAHRGWLTLGDYDVFAWSVSGVESSVAVKCEDFYLCFDMGAAVEESVRARHVFITHGHSDHISAVSAHASKRRLTSMTPAHYYVPPHLADPLTRVITAHLDMAEAYDGGDGARVVPFEQGDTAQLKSKFLVKSFPTDHRVKSQGYIVYKQDRKLKDEFRGMKGFEIAKLHREGTTIHDVITTPEIAYTGDTTFSVFTDPPTPDLLKVKLLITEATYIDHEKGKDTVASARARGHIHLSDIVNHESVFVDVGHILLVHFSAKYPAKFIVDILRDNVPPSLRSKMTPALVAQLTKPQTTAGDNIHMY